MCYNTEVAMNERRYYVLAPEFAIAKSLFHLWAFFFIIVPIIFGVLRIIAVCGIIDVFTNKKD